MPIRVRLSALAAVGALVMSVIGGAVFLRQLRNGLHASVDSSLRSRADQLVQRLPDGNGGDFQDPGATPLVSTGEAIAQVITPAGKVAEASEAAGTQPLASAVVLRAAAQRVVFAEGRLPGTREPARLLVTSVAGRGGRWIVVVGTSLSAVDDALERVRLGLFVGGMATVLIATAGAWVLGTIALRPVERMRRQAAAISAQDDATALAVPKTRDEIARLGATMNAMLDRLRGALARQRMFVADAGHELRTPLAILRAELELASRPGRGVEELQQAIDDAGDETDRLIRLADQLLFLARYDEGVDLQRRVNLPLQPLLDIAADRARRTRRDVTVDVAAPPDLRADVMGDDLRRAIENLVDNALRYAPPHSAIAITAVSHRADVAITVGDRGPGFPTDFLPEAFERFRRADTGRGSDSGGTGLGLAIVRAGAREHDGDATARNRDGGGAEVEIRIATARPGRSA